VNIQDVQAILVKQNSLPEKAATVLLIIGGVLAAIWTVIQIWDWWRKK